MGRPGFTRHPKFRRLAADLGSRLLARGALEMLWDTAYENGEPYLGDARAVELAAEWDGDSGVLLRAFLEAGGEGASGFVDEVAPGRYSVHDLWDHAPDYVRKRRKREIQRRDMGRQFADDDRTVTGQCPPNGMTPAPAPAPAPAPDPLSVDPEGSTREPDQPALPLDPDPEPHEKVSIDRDQVPYKLVVEQWNKICGDVLPQVTEITAARKAAIRQRIKQVDGFDALVVVFGRVRASDFLTGKVPGKDFRATFDFVMGPKNFVKVVEGNYDNRGHGKKQTDDGGWQFGFSQADQEAHGTDPQWDAYLKSGEETYGWGGELGRWPTFEEWTQGRQR